MRTRTVRIRKKRAASTEGTFFRKSAEKETFFPSKCNGCEKGSPGPRGPLTFDVKSTPNGGFVNISTGKSIPTKGNVPTNTVHCLMRWTPCSAPYSPGSWGARVTYHCPRFIWPLGIILPGTTESSYVTIPDEFVGTGPRGGRLYRCRHKPQTLTLLTVADTVAATTNRMRLYPDFVSCHAGFRGLLLRMLDAAFAPSGGGPSGVRVNATFPPGMGFPC